MSSPNLSAPPPLSHPPHSPTSKHRLPPPSHASALHFRYCLVQRCRGGTRNWYRRRASDVHWDDDQRPQRSASDPRASPFAIAFRVVHDERIPTHVNRIFDSGSVYRVEQHDRHQYVLELARRPSVVHMGRITGNSARYSPSRQRQRPSSRLSGLA